jgi:hypothetical protein
MKHCKIFYLFLFIMLIWFTVGCAYTASFNRSPYIDQVSLQNYLITKKGKSPEEIIFLKKVPDQPIVILGTLHAPEVEWTAHYTTDDLIKAMQKKAAEIGADAILDFRTNNKGYAKKGCRDWG